MKLTSGFIRAGVMSAKRKSNPIEAAIRRII